MIWMNCGFCKRDVAWHALHYVDQFGRYCSRDCAYAGFAIDILRHRFVHPVVAYGHFVDECERTWGA